MALNKLHRGLTNQLVFGFPVATINADAYDAMPRTEQLAFLRRVAKIWGTHLEGVYDAKSNTYKLHQPADKIREGQ